MRQGFRHRLLPAHQEGQTDSEVLSSTKTAGNQASAYITSCRQYSEGTPGIARAEGLILNRYPVLKSEQATHLIVLIPGEVLRCQDKPVLLGATLHDPNVVDGEPALSDDLRGWKQ